MPSRRAAPSRDRGAGAVRRGALAVGGRRHRGRLLRPSVRGGLPPGPDAPRAHLPLRLRRPRGCGPRAPTGMDIEQFAGAHVTVESAPIAAQALRRGSRGRGRRRSERPVARGVRRACLRARAAGVRADGRGRPRVRRHPRRPADVRRRRSTTPTGACCGRWARRRRSRRWRGSSPPSSRRRSQLEQRIDLARELHEGVIQRLFGVSMALDGDGELPASARRRCAEETQAALTDLRAALQRPLGRAPRATQDDAGRRGRAPRRRPSRISGCRWRRGRRATCRRRSSRWPSRCSSRRCATPTSTPSRPTSTSG